jgi:4-hydroxyphenylpyruvate dioxygenase-like putative hemolysin
VRHGVPGQGFAKAYNRALELGAQPIHIETGPMELNLPAIKGIGGAPLYLIDRFGEGSSIYDIDFVFIEGVDRNPVGAGLKIIDHLTHNVYRGAWPTGPTSTRSCSTSAKSATSTSRANTPA